jgi:hypothetical protein
LTVWFKGGHKLAISEALIEYSAQRQYANASSSWRQYQNHLSMGMDDVDARINYLRTIEADEELSVYRDSPSGKGMSVVYAAVNIVNGMTYVGKHDHGKAGRSVASTRWRVHFVDSGCRRFHNALKCYGAQSFLWFVIDRAMESVVEEYEAFWIEHLKTLSPSGYNLVVHSKKNQFSPETRKRISDAAKRRFQDPGIRAETSDRQLRIQNAPQHREKMSKAKLAQGAQKRAIELAACMTREQREKVERKHARSIKECAYHKHRKDNGIARVRAGSAEHHSLRRVAIEAKRVAALEQCSTTHERDALKQKHAALDRRAASRKRVGYRPS